MPPQTRLVIRALDSFVDDLIKQLTTEITSELVRVTPVDTGWARSNWVPSIGEPLDEPVGNRDTNITAGPQQEGLATVISSYMTSQGSVFISNNVPYITLLNEGSSQQAPSGFVQNSIAVAVREVVRRNQGR